MFWQNATCMILFILFNFKFNGSLCQIPKLPSIKSQYGSSILTVLSSHLQWGAHMQQLFLSVLLDLFIYKTKISDWVWIFTHWDGTFLVLQITQSVSPYQNNLDGSSLKPGLHWNIKDLADYSSHFYVMWYSLPENRPRYYKKGPLIKRGLHSFRMNLFSSCHPPYSKSIPVSLSQGTDCKWNHPSFSEGWPSLVYQGFDTKVLLF